MTIKQQGGIFGRNPTFNDVTVNDITVDTLSSPAVDLQSNGVADFKKFISITDTNVRINMIETDTTDENTQIRNQSGNFEVRTLADNLESGTTRLKIDHTNGDTTVSTGNLIIGTSGKGIDFSATAGTGTSELFDDYEEGSWTVTVTPATGSLTSYNQAGYYTKIGRNVQLYFFFQITSIGTAGGAATITGLPFTASSSAQSAGSASENAVSGVAGVTHLQSTTSVLVKDRNGATPFAASAYWLCAISYFV